MTSPKDDADLERLLGRAADGDIEARQRLLGRYRDRLRKAVAAQLDRRLRARVDASDVVQDVLADADRRLGPFLEGRPLPFYAWLRQIARDRMRDLRRRHLGAARRSVSREGPWTAEGPERSSDGTSPSGLLIRDELRERVRAAMALLDDRDRTALVLRHVEGRTAGEAAKALGLNEEALKSRHRRALERLRALLDGDAPGGPT